MFTKYVFYLRTEFSMKCLSVVLIYIKGYAMSCGTGIRED